MERYYQVLKVNLKYNLRNSIFVIITFLLISPFIIGMENLSEPEVACILETYISLFGIVLFIPIFIPDEDLSIRYLIQSKKQSMLKTHLIRLFEQILILLISIFLFMFILNVNNCDFDFLNLYLGVIANNVLLGGIGVICYSLVNSLPFAYMIPTFYYVICYGVGKDILGKMYLFSLSLGLYEDSIIKLIIGVLLIFLGIFYRDFLIKFYK
ncbi:MAG: hypothetical protein E7214_15780 [Clostridium sp.]|nr:hypothetical protein [Clostridium sp.]